MTVASTRLSDCELWQRQREYFSRSGIDTWRHNVCPSYVTTNAFVGDAYARLVHAWARDLGPGEPIDVLELGAGSGRFGHHFLRAFLELDARVPSRGIRYVLSDVAPSMVEFWKGHDRLRPLVERGVLDLAVVEASGDARLATSGRPLGGRPLVAIANYVFDSIEQDLFVLEKGRLLEGLVGSLPPSTGADDWLADLEILPAFAPSKDPPYSEPHWNAILDGYRERLPDGALLFPVGALRSIARLRALAGGKLLVLSADKGVVHEQDLAGQPVPGLVKHGSFSLQVDYNALAEFVRRTGGFALAPGAAHVSIAVLALVTGATAAECPALGAAWDAGVARFGPDDFYVLKRTHDGKQHEMMIEPLLALLRLSGWDGSVVFGAYARLLDIIKDATLVQRRTLLEGLKTAWDRYFPFGEETDLALRIGRLLIELEAWDDALPILEASIHVYGESEASFRYVQRCLDAIAARSAASPSP